MHGITVVTPPTDEPVSLARAKLHLRRDVNDEDVNVTAGIAAARRLAEEFSGRFFLSQTVRLKFSDWPSDDVIRLTPFGPNDITSIAAFSYLDISGDAQNISNATYQSEFSVNPPVIAPLPTVGWPDLESGRLFPITLDLVVGAANATVLDERVGQAILLTLGYWDSDRGDEGLAESMETRGLPIGAKRLLTSIWSGSYG